MSNKTNPALKTFKSLLPLILLITTVTMVVLLINIHEVRGNVQTAAEEFKQSEPGIGKTTGYQDPNKVNPVQTTKNTITGSNDTDANTTFLEKIRDYAIFAVILISIAVPSAFGIYFLYKFRKRITIKWLFSVALGIVSVASTFLVFFYLYWYFLYPELGVPYSDWFVLMFILPPSLVGGIAVIYGIVSKRSNTKIRNRCLLVLSGLISTFLVLVLHPAALMFMIMLLIVWDIFATKKGPIKWIIDITDKDAAEKKKKRRDDAARAAQAAAAQQIQTGAPGDNIPSAASITPPSAVATLAAKRPSLKERQIQSNIEKAKARDESVSLGGPVHVKGPKPAPAPAEKAVQVQKAKATAAPPPSKVEAPKKEEDDLEVLMLFGLYDAEDFSIGLGDLIFYSVFTAMAMMYFLYWLPFYGFYPGLELGIVVSSYVAIFIMIAVLVGFLKTLQLLEKNYILPGLPISMAIGLVCFLVFLGILEVVNKVFYGYFVPVF